MSFRVFLLLLLVTISVSSAAPTSSSSCIAADRNSDVIWSDLLHRYLSGSTISEVCGVSDLGKGDSDSAEDSIGDGHGPAGASTPNVTIPSDIKPPSGNDVVQFALHAKGIRIYQCLSVNSSSTEWVEQVSRACLFPNTQSSDVVVAGIFNPTIPGRAYYGNVRPPFTAFQVHQQARIPSPDDPTKDLVWELAAGESHLYQSGNYRAKYDFRKVTFHNRVLTQGGNSPTADKCTSGTIGQKFNSRFQALYIFYGQDKFTCPYT